MKHIKLIKEEAQLLETVEAGGFLQTVPHRLALAIR